MSNHNYSQYSNNKKHRNHNNYNNNRDVINTAPTPVEPAVEVEPNVYNPVVENVVPMTETVETVVLPKTVQGIVSGCTKLNVRANPTTTADVVCVLDAMTEIAIDVDKSTSEWFHVCTVAGIEGYCMRRYVEARL